MITVALHARSSALMIVNETRAGSLGTLARAICTLTAGKVPTTPFDVTHMLT